MKGFVYECRFVFDPHHPDRSSMIGGICPTRTEDIKAVLEVFCINSSYGDSGNAVIGKIQIFQRANSLYAMKSLQSRIHLKCFSSQSIFIQFKLDLPNHLAHEHRQGESVF
ncbi:MAG: hypothetical protein IPK03_04785 [Bacteroidetes bacterium]|nr:hypothetical protein [Bacteroidota bacterium]